MKNKYMVEGDKVYITVKCKGKILETVIDVNDLSLVKSFPHTWIAKEKKYGYYVEGVMRDGKGVRRTHGLHRWILNPESHLVVDHIDHDGLNNTRNNLRPATYVQNGLNRRKKNRGVSWSESKKAWVVQLSHNSKRFYLELDSKEKAEQVAEQELKRIYEENKI